MKKINWQDPKNENLAYLLYGIGILAMFGGLAGGMAWISHTFGNK